jgi:hypothetical protein
MRVVDLDGTKASASGNKWNATVTITVRDANQNLVNNATVRGTWSNDISQSVNCTTNSSGQCSWTSSNVKKSDYPSLTFTVTGITHSTFTYNSAGNSDPDGDSNGTAIAITKP